VAAVRTPVTLTPLTLFDRAAFGGDDYVHDDLAAAAALNPWPYLEEFFQFLSRFENKVTVVCVVDKKKPSNTRYFF
jgi:hypothetical protein